MDANEMIKEKKAMTLTGLSRTTLYKYRRDGLVRFKTNPKGRVIKYNVKDLLKFI